jgi:large subunit ribosomal protein L21
VTLAEVMMLGGEESKIGAPLVAGASVIAEIVEHGRGPKILVFKKRRRQNSRRKRGHRQEFTLLRIAEILTEPRKDAKPARKKQDAAAETDERKPARARRKAAPAEAEDESAGADASAAAGAAEASSDAADAAPKKPRARRPAKKTQTEQPE